MRKNRKKKRTHIIRLIGFFLIILGIFSYITNPFTKYSLIKDPYVVILDPSGQIDLQMKFPLNTWVNPLSRSLGQTKSAWHILVSRINPKSKSKYSDVISIIRDIHASRFDPREPYLISGEHFSVLYPRSLGIFYNTLLDGRTALDIADWQNRQAIYLKTTAYALAVFTKANRLSTTIVPLGPTNTTLVNIYAYPSDSLFSILYALTVMKSDAEIRSIYPYGITENQIDFSLQTKEAATRLLRQYLYPLARLLNQYDQIYDQGTGLIKKSVDLSSTKDSVVRQSSFYDNVIFWKTHSLAQQLGIEPANEQFLTRLKDRIISSFWLPDEGYFLEDLSDVSIKEKHYSSDWLIAFTTGFLSPDDPKERQFLVRSVQYIQNQRLDYPFGLKYQNSNQKNRLHLTVKLLAPTYATTSIWSNWGIEYNKLLMRLFTATCDRKLMTLASTQLDVYSDNILRYQGYPEVYDTNGLMYNKVFYRSVRNTGWIVNFEQAIAMRSSILSKETSLCPNRN